MDTTGLGNLDASDHIRWSSILTRGSIVQRLACLFAIYDRGDGFTDRITIERIQKSFAEMINKQGLKISDNFLSIFKAGCRAAYLTICWANVPKKKSHETFSWLISQLIEISARISAALTVFSFPRRLLNKIQKYSQRAFFVFQQDNYFFEQMWITLVSDA